MFHILLVDDDEIIRETIKSFLSPLSIRFSECDDGTLALDKIQQQEFDLVISDINMPTMSGLELCHKVRKDFQFHHLPIILITGLQDEGLIQQAFETGATDYVHKPLNRWELLSRTQSVIERRRAERELFFAKRDAEKANEAKSDFVSAMSHEMKTPLNAIMGFSQLIEYDMDNLNQDQQDNIVEIIKASKHLQELINDTLDLAKIEAGKLRIQIEEVDITLSLSDCIALVQPLAQQRNISIHFQPRMSVQIFADPTRLKQVLLNLLSNAIKYNQESGSIRIETERLSQSEIAISIEDSGHGMDDDQLQQLFDPFNRLSAEGSAIEGTGLGLSLSRRLIELMEGHIDVQSTVGEGSIFTIILPCR